MRFRNWVATTCFRIGIKSGERTKLLKNSRYKNRRLRFHAFLTLALCMSVALETSFADEPLFVGVPKVEIGLDVGDFVLADFNLDGRPDLAANDRDANEIVILLGTANAGFSVSQIAVDTSPRIIRTADLNRDELPDMVYLSESRVYVLLGLGDGTFQEPMIVPTTGPVNVFIGDVNQDSNPDLVFRYINNFPESLAVVLGNGDGTFGTENFITIDRTPSEITVADLNADGFNDLIYNDNQAAGNQSELRILFGNGDATFSSPVILTVGAFPSIPLVEDLNGDEIVDIVTVNRGFPDDISILLGLGDGRFADEVTQQVDGNVGGGLLADIDSDGNVDVVAGASVFGTGISVFYGNGDGSFSPERHFRSSYPIRAIATANFNDDLLPDIALVTTRAQSDVLEIFYGVGDGNVRSMFDVRTGEFPYSVTVGDFDGDGILDMASANRLSDDVSVFLGAGEADFGLTPTLTIPIGNNPWSVSSGDFNGDGLDDLVASNGFSDDVSVLLSLGDGNFAPEQRFSTGENPWSVAAIDINGDSLIDAVTANRDSDSVSVLLGNGDGTFEQATDFAAGDNPVSVTVSDFNNDGDLDLATANRNSNDVSILLGDGTGQFDAALDYPVGTAPYSVASADLNGDGFDDLLSANRISSDVSILLGAGDGTFSPGEDAFEAEQPFGVTTGDLNRDGKVDVVVADRDEQEFAYYLGNGDGTFGTAQVLRVFDRPVDVVAVDIDLDGWQDLISVNRDTDSVSVFLSQRSINPLIGDVNLDCGINLLDVASFVAVLQSGEYLTEADTNQDGQVDLLDVSGFVKLLSN